MGSLRTGIDDRCNYTADPENVPLDAVRLECGDIDENQWLVTDKEIEHYLTKSNDDVLMAAYRAALQIKAFLSRKLMQRGSGVSDNIKDLVANAKELVADLRRRLPHAIPTAPQLRYSTRGRLLDDTDLVPPKFHEGMHRVDSIGQDPGTVPGDAD